MTPNIPWIKLAARQMNLDFKVLDSDEGLGVLTQGIEHFYFVNCATPFNRQDLSRVAKDKYFTYLICKDLVLTPKTLIFIDPASPLTLQDYVRFNSIRDIVNESILRLGEDIIVKKNSGQRNENVFSCKSSKEIELAFIEIFNKNSSKYDYIGLAQEKVTIIKELRVIVGYGEVLLVYQKWKFTKVTDALILSRVKDFVHKIHERLELNFMGLDLAINHENQLVLIEINSAPRLEFYVRENGASEVINIFKFVITKFLNSRSGINTNNLIIPK